MTKVDRDLAAVASRLRIAHLNPINVNDERKKIFNDNCYNPHFKYKVKPSDYTQYTKKLHSLETDKSVYGTLLRKKIIELERMIALLQHIGKRDFTKYSVQLYNKPSQDLVKEAKHILEANEESLWERYAKKHKPRKQGTPYSRLSLNKIFSDTFKVKRYDWDVIEKEMVAGAAVSTKNKVLYLNKKRPFTAADVQRLIIHEIGTHATRAENGAKQPYKLFHYGFPNYLVTEEGLAAYNEYRHGLLSPTILRNYAGRVIANHHSLKHNFSSVYNHLLDYFPKHDAWTLTLRSKRGLTNTSKPGAFTKDHIYLKGFLAIKHYAEQGGDLTPLMIGKIGLEHIQLLSLL